MGKSNWPGKYPWNNLPRGGTHPYVPPRKDWLKKPPKGDRNGYIDQDGNEWVPAPAPDGDEDKFHWDVQHESGKHTNVRPDGEIHHGKDNFP
jgi:hypothetical protein